MQAIQTINDTNGITTGVIIPIELWQKILPKIQNDIQMISQPRPIGLAKGEWQTPPSFFEPLPDDLSKAFSGMDE
jgi:hypothetical protein